MDLILLLAISSVIVFVSYRVNLFLRKREIARLVAEILCEGENINPKHGCAFAKKHFARIKSICAKHNILLSQVDYNKSMEQLKIEAEKSFDQSEKYNVQIQELIEVQSRRSLAAAH